MIQGIQLRPSTQRADGSAIVAPAPMLRILTVISIIVTFVLLPLERVQLPLNLSPMDLWTLFTLPILWMFLLLGRKSVYFPFGAAMWLLLLASCLSTFGASDPLASLVAILKEVYIYVWFVTLVAVFTNLNDHDRQWILSAWLGVVLLHGVLLIAQFVSPTILRVTTANVADFGPLGSPRPCGLFDNANACAFFQLMGFVPLLLWRRSTAITTMLGLVLVLAVAATGSLAAILGFLVGLIVALLASVIFGGRVGVVVNLIVLVAVAASLLGGLWFVAASQSPDLQERIVYISLGRAQGSADRRTGLWQDALDTVSSETFLRGVGPGNWHDERDSGKTLHNDLLAFLVERGVLGMIAFAFFLLLMVRRASQMLAYRKDVPQAVLWAGLFLAAIASTIVYSQFHQVFHTRSLWLMLAVMAALLQRMALVASARSSSPRHLTRATVIAANMASS